VATPSSDAIVSAWPSASIRDTVPSKRLETCSRPCGSKAIEVALVRPVTNTSRTPSAPTRYTDTLDCWPRDPLQVA
jgi:hypothetical protein